MGSRLEELLAWHLRATGCPSPEREATLIPGRRFRCDFAWPAPEHRLVVEVEGGLWVGGRHSRPSGFIADAEKYNVLTLAGWRVLRVTGEQIRSGKAIGWIRQALGMPENGGKGTKAGRTVAKTALGGGGGVRAARKSSLARSS